MKKCKPKGASSFLNSRAFISSPFFFLAAAGLPASFAVLMTVNLSSFLIIAFAFSFTLHTKTIVMQFVKLQNNTTQFQYHTKISIYLGLTVRTLN